MDNDFDYNEGITTIADGYGLVSQLHQLAEECSELAVASSHSARTGNITINLIEEMADVEIMMDQIKHLGKIREGFVNELKEMKIKRQLDRMSSSSYEIYIDKEDK